MLRFLKHLCVFAVIMIACDVAVGAVCRHLVSHAKGGITAKREYITKHADEQVLIFGSSRAMNHYDPYILEEQLGTTVYNCGFQGYGIIYAYGFFHMAQSRYTPSIVVLDYTPWLSHNGTGGLGELSYYYDSEGVDSIFWAVDAPYRYKMLSQMYRYNCNWAQVLMDNIHPLQSNDKGFNAPETEMTDNYKPFEDLTGITPHPLKLYYLERFIKECEGKTLLIVVVSPEYKNTYDAVVAPVQALCEEYDVPFLDHYTDSAFNFTREYFIDRYHLNRRGATAYSHVIAEEIKALRERSASAER